MDKIFQGLPIKVVMMGNLMVSLIGALFIYGAPVKSEYKNLKHWFLLFWCCLVLYFAVGSAVNVPPWRANRFLQFSDPNYEQSFVRTHGAWLIMVILSDLPIIALTFGYSFFLWRKKYSPWALILPTSIVFFAAWISAAFFKVNSISSAAAFCVFLYLAWSCREEHITSSVLLITYAFLHLPIGLAVNLPLEWRHSIFVLLLVSKLSLIIAMYDILEVKSAKNIQPTPNKRIHRSRRSAVHMVSRNAVRRPGDAER